MYEQLRELAAAKLGLEKPGQTLDTTGMVHEVILSWAATGRPPPATTTSKPARRCAELSSIASALDKAAVVLRRAAAAGYKPVDAMKRDPDLDPLRGRPDFQSLMMDLAFPSNPFAAEGVVPR